MQYYITLMNSGHKYWYDWNQVSNINNPNIICKWCYRFTKITLSTVWNAFYRLIELSQVKLMAQYSFQMTTIATKAKMRLEVCYSFSIRITDNTMWMPLLTLFYSKFTPATSSGIQNFHICQSKTVILMKFGHKKWPLKLYLKHQSNI